MPSPVVGSTPTGGSAPGDGALTVSQLAALVDGALREHMPAPVSVIVCVAALYALAVIPTGMAPAASTSPA